MSQSAAISIYASRRTMVTVYSRSPHPPSPAESSLVLFRFPGFPVDKILQVVGPRAPSPNPRPFGKKPLMDPIKYPLKGCFFSPRRNRHRGEHRFPVHVAYAPNIPSSIHVVDESTRAACLTSLWSLRRLSEVKTSANCEF